MKNKKVHKLFIISALGVCVLLSATRAEAWHWKHHGHHKQHHGHDYGKIVFKLPWDFISIVVNGRDYKYHNGQYYKKHSHGWKAVRAPHGACIARLPRGYKKVHIGKHHYYAHNGVYYKNTPNGYLVVDDPTPRYSVAKKVKVYADYDEKYNVESFTINIPRTSGGYKSVELTREGDGFIGPQGEYYDEFPRVAQLRVVYDL